MIRLDRVGLKLVGAAGPVNILNEIDLAVAPGETVAVIGPSGSGKTSLMMVLGGLERASEGRVTIDGVDYAGLDEDGLARFRRDRIGIVFQSFHLIPTMTALENVALPLEFAGAADAFARARHGLAAVGLGHRLGHYPSRLSGGEQQRVAIARALAPSPRLIIADEPTGNLDGETGRGIVALLFDLAVRAGTSLVLVTHDPALAARCGRIVEIADGRILRDHANHTEGVA